MRVAICDDEINQLNYSKEQLENSYKSLDLLVDIYTDGNKLIKKLLDIQYDLIILDIEMPLIDGLSVARQIRTMGLKTPLVFLTSHVEYAISGYEVNALRYLTKPVDAKKISEIITYLVEQSANDKKLMLKKYDDMVMVSVKDIIYMESRDQDIRVVTAKDEYFRRYNIKDYEEELKSYFFVRPHRSYLVNLAHINRVTSTDIIVSNGDILPMSRMKAKSIKEALISYTKRSAM